MSDYESHKGTLYPTEHTKEELVYKYVETSPDSSWEARYKNQDLDENIINEIFWDIEEYTEINGKIYKIQDKEFDPDSDIFEMEKNEDGTLDYHVRFYNGGCGFEEALSTAAMDLKG